MIVLIVIPLILLILGGTAISLFAIQKEYSTKPKPWLQELSAGRLENDTLRRRVAELEDMNHQLRLQLEWHVRLLGPNGADGNVARRLEGSTAAPTETERHLPNSLPSSQSMH